MNYTQFGEFMRIQRVKHHEVMGDIAEVLKTSTPFLSAVENGKKNVPEGWFDILAEHYSLTEEEVSEMKIAAEKSKPQLKIALTKATKNQRDMVYEFARSFDGIDDETALKILEILKRGNSVDGL